MTERVIKYRWREQNTLKELGTTLSYVFSNSEFNELCEKKSLKYWEMEKEPSGPFPWVVWVEQESRLIAFLFPCDSSVPPCGGVAIKPILEPFQLDMDFAKAVTHVFNEDVRVACDLHSHSELWMSLRQTQFRRAIARHTSFSTLPMVRWMQIVENSTSLRYEGKPFSFCLFMAKQRKHITGPLGSAFIPFHKPLNFENAILNEKWIRAAVDGSRVGLLGVGHAGEIVGMLAMPGPEFESDLKKFAPHESLAGVQGLLCDGTMAFVTSAQGDIYMFLPNGAIFFKSQGRWHYLNYEAVHKTLSMKLTKETSISILRAALDLSFEKKGALICVVESEKEVKKFIPDHNDKKKTNLSLRNSLKGLCINDWSQRQIILSAATADGALIINSDGKVIDVACMVSDPPLEDIVKHGHKKLERMPGAKSTAAWNSSIYGLSIKVSEDGPITIYEKGYIVGILG